MRVSWYGDDVKKQIEDALLKGVDDSLDPIARTARANAPVDTGKLKASIKVVRAKQDGGEIFGMVLVDVDYAVFPEVKKPYLRPAMMANENGSLKNFENKLK